MIRFENVLKRSLQDVLKTSWRRVEDTLKTSWRHMTKTIILVLIKTSWSWSRHLLKRYELGEYICLWSRLLQDVLKAYDQDDYIGLDQDVLKTSSEDEGERLLQGVFKASSSRWMFAGVGLNSFAYNKWHNIFTI